METKAYKSAISIVAKMQALSALPKRTGFLAVFEEPAESGKNCTPSIR
ncbi:hypothetical protein V2S84_09855 [Azotobacter chroococcum]|nr:hypothetical protein [Azotobacter chroococcum]